MAAPEPRTGLARRAGLVRLAAAAAAHPAGAALPPIPRSELELQVVEHGTSPAGRWLREHRLRVALWIAVAEGVLVVFGVVPAWLALAAAAAVVAFYLLAGRSLRAHWARELALVGSISQALVALVPLLIVVAAALAIAVLAVVALVALVALAVVVTRR